MSARLIILIAGTLGVLAAAGVLLVWITGGMSTRSPEIANAVVRAEGPGCGFFKVAATTLNIFKEPRSASDFIIMLDKNDIVCVARDQQVGDVVWAYMAYKLEKQNQRKTIDGWAIKRSVQPASPAEVAALRGTPESAPPPAAEAVAPAGAVVRFSEPLSFGPFPVNGHSLEELIAGIPMFLPIQGLDESAWKKTCNNCHKWDRQTLCAQGSVYVKNPKAALRIPHPYGGAEKIAMMKWAESGCQ